LADEQAAAQRARRDAAAAAALQPPLPPRTRERRRVKEAAALAVLVLAVFGFAGYKFVANAAHTRHVTAATHPKVRAGPVPGSTPSVQASPASASLAPATPSPVSPPPPRVLAPASVAAFGPAGTADGENPQYAALAVAGRAANPWYSYVSASPVVPGPTPGTGLLLDMGRTVTVTSVRVSMNGDRGAALQLRAGAKPILSWLPPIASASATASGASGTLLLQPRAPVQVRYVLIWFTQLPPDLAGTYQASVYQVTVLGQV
jgi:hypothetical protein